MNKEMITRPSGYCPMCDTVYDKPHECSVGKQENVYATKIWNAAIEAAADVVDDCNKEGPYQAIGAASRIRKLKK